MSAFEETSGPAGDNSDSEASSDDDQSPPPPKEPVKPRHRNVLTTKRSLMQSPSYQKTSGAGKPRLVGAGNDADPCIIGKDNYHYKPGYHLFTASWCGHCKNLKANNAPLFKKHSRPNDPHHDLLEIEEDSSVESHENINAIPTQFGLTGFPTSYMISTNNKVSEIDLGKCEGLVSNIPKQGKLKAKARR